MPPHHSCAAALPPAQTFPSSIKIPGVRLSANARGLVLISATELGFGVEHMFNENLGLFAEYNLRTFQVKLKVDADEFVDDLEDALNELEAGTSVETDLDDFQFIQGDATAKFRNLTSYASLGLALYF